MARLTAMLPILTVAGLLAACSDQAFQVRQLEIQIARAGFGALLSEVAGTLGSGSGTRGSESDMPSDKIAAKASNGEPGKDDGSDGDGEPGTDDGTDGDGEPNEVG